MKERVAIVIPYYHSQLSKLEKISFQQCLKVLYRHPIILVVPDTMDEQEYPESHEFIFTKVPSLWLESISTYNQMMLNIEFYKKFIQYEYILIYQLDAFVFRDEIIEFCNLNYDYIGAPWPLGVRYVKDHQNCIWYVGNGGFSLRNVEKSIAMLKKNPAGSWERQEDIYWAACNSAEFCVAPKEVACQFAIEGLAKEMFEENGRKLPVGCHAWEKMDFLFWKPFLEKEGYCFSDEMSGNLDKISRNMPLDILTVPRIIINAYLRKLSHHEETCIFIWGTGEKGKEIILFLRHLNFSLRCIDSDAERWGEYLWDVQIEEPSVLNEIKDKVLIIIAADKEEEQVLMNFCRVGFRYKYNVFLYDEVVDAVRKEYKCYLHKNNTTSNTKEEERYKIIARCFDKWLTESENNNFIREFLQKRNIKRVGVYGYGMLGRHLVFELRQSDISVEWIMDKRGDVISCGYPVLNPDKTGYIPEVDIIIVTAVADFDEVEAMLYEKADYPVISLMEIVKNMRFFREKL